MARSSACSRSSMRPPACLSSSRVPLDLSSSSTDIRCSGSTKLWSLPRASECASASADCSLLVIRSMRIAQSRYRTQAISASCGTHFNPTSSVGWGDSIHFNGVRPPRSTAPYGMDSRQHPRVQLPIEVELLHPTIGKLRRIARDLSEGGVFVVTEPGTLRPGSHLKLTVVNTALIEATPTPTIDMEVVRV